MSRWRDPNPRDREVPWSQREGPTARQPRNGSSFNSLLLGPWAAVFAFAVAGLAVFAWSSARTELAQTRAALAEARDAVESYSQVVGAHSGDILARLRSSQERVEELEVALADARARKLFVVTEPRGARVQIVNIGPRFRQGIVVPVERVELYVFSDGYEGFREWIELGEGTNRVFVTLQQKGFLERLGGDESSAAGGEEERQ